MAVSIEEFLMAEGRWSVDFRPDPEIFEALDPDLNGKAHLYVYLGEELLCPPLVVHKRDGVPGAATISGSGLAWYLGNGERGPVVREREWYSGQSRLDNGDFGAEADPLEHWSLPEGSKWVATTDVFRSAPAAAITAEPSDDADVMVSKQSWTVRAGEHWRHFLYAGRFFGGIGRVICRTVLTGRFTHPNLFPAFASWSGGLRDDIQAATDPMGVVAGPLWRVQTDIPNLAPNGEFDDAVGLNGWVQGPGAWYTVNDGTAWSTPTYAFTNTAIVVAGVKTLTNDAGGGVTAPAAPRAVAAGETWQIRLVVRPHPGVTTDGEAWANILLYSGATVTAVIETERVQGDATGWTILLHDVDIPEGVDGFTLQAACTHTTGQWDFDSGTIIRVGGNVDARVSPLFDVFAGRTSRLEAPYRVDPGVTSGRVELQVIAYSFGRPDLIIPGPELTQSDAAPDPSPSLQHASWEVTLPSGYSTARLQIFAQDVVGGAVWVGQGRMQDTDETTRWYEARSNPVDAPWAGLRNDVVVPQGAETIHGEVVAETLGQGWVVDDVWLGRADVPISTHADVIRSLLIDPATGLPLSVQPGAIVGDDPIPFDWSVRNQTVKALLEHFVRVVASPAMEWYIGLDARLVAGPPEEIFTDHRPYTDDEVLLVETDLDVIELPAVAVDTSERVTEVLVVGAELNSSTGPPHLVTATALGGFGARDLLGNFVRRTLVVEDSTVEYSTYAQAVAGDELAKANRPTSSLTVALRDPGGRPAVRPGDWIYAYKPDAGLESPAYSARDATGRSVFPARIRVQGIRRELGRRHRIVVRLPDGTEFDLPDVVWSTDAVSLELGDPPAEFERDDQGGDVGRQYLRWRASRPL